MSLKELIVNRNDSSRRLDKFIFKCFDGLPASLVYKFIRTKRIKVNGKRAKENLMLKEGDRVLVFLPADFETPAEPGRANMRKSSGKVKICYEDENILIADKEKGLLCHSGGNERSDTLIDRIQAYLIEKGEYNPEEENSFSPSLCNRIDRNTEGLVIAAKNAESLRVMNEIIKRREAEKFYLAACHGIFKRKKGGMVSYLKKNSASNTVYVSTTPNPGAKTSLLDYEVIAEDKDKDLSLLKINLKTGRTHQIRAQLSQAGHPLLGEGKYAVNKRDRACGFYSQALCSWEIKFCFNSDKGVLNYLNGLRVRAEKPDFIRLFNAMTVQFPGE